MDTYTLVLIIHLFCAIMFVGFVFADVVVFPAWLNRYSPKEVKEIKQTIIKRGVKIYPPAVLLLMLTGGYMFSKYVNSSAGYFDSTMQQLLWLKLFFVLLIVLGVIFALINKARGIEETGFMKYFHAIALILSVAIVILAKVMFVI